MAALRIVAESLCNSAVDSYSEVLPLVLPKNRIQFFTHRKNSDGTIDSICRQCLTTVAIEHLEIMLIHREREHVCDMALETKSHFRLNRAR